MTTEVYSTIEIRTILRPMLNTVMKRVQQRSIWHADCGVACVAMLAECSYAEARKALGFAEDAEEFYTWHCDIFKALSILGCSVKKRKFGSWRKISERAIVAVNFTRDGYYWHWVAFDGEAILDPKPNRPGRKTDLRGLHGKGVYFAMSAP